MILSIGVLNFIIYNVRMKLIIGLGNPGKEYKNTRHNAGFQCVDLLRKKLGLPEFKLQKKFFALVSEGTYEGEKIALAQPQTFMNASGKTARALMNFYKIPPQDLWLIYDDIDLALGKIRIRASGSSGSHNGMKSVIESLGFENFPRIRIGIESRGEQKNASSEQNINSFVLCRFGKKEEKIIHKSLETGAQAFLAALKKGVGATMEKFN